MGLRCRCAHGRTLGGSASSAPFDKHHNYLGTVKAQLLALIEPAVRHKGSAIIDVISPLDAATELI